MSEDNFLSRLAAPAVLVLAAGCSSGQGQNQAASDDRDAAGKVVLQEEGRDIVKIARVESAPDGSVTYSVSNVSGKLQDDLSYHVEFRYPSGSKASFENIDDVELSPETDLVLLKSDDSKPLTVRNPKPGGTVKETKIKVQNLPPIALVAREGGQMGTGTILLDRAVECVGIADEDTIRAGSLWIELENVSGQPLTALEAKAVFVDQRSGEKKAESTWKSMRDIKPGARARVDLDIASLGKVSHLTLLVKVRRQQL